MVNRKSTLRGVVLLELLQVDQDLLTATSAPILIDNNFRLFPL
jgi:hypothetical protein